MLGIHKEPVVTTVQSLLAAGEQTDTFNGTSLDLGEAKNREEIVLLNVNTLTDIAEGQIIVQQSFDDTNWSFLDQIKLKAGVAQIRINRRERYLRVRGLIEASDVAPSVTLSATLLQ